MRKESHISLARYMVAYLGDEDLKKHRFSFYLGSILPDIKPSFVYKRHEIGRTFPSICRKISKLSEGKRVVKKERESRKYYMDLGEVSHYLADYFTYPHNKCYKGSMKDHCVYEGYLTKGLHRYIKSPAAKRPGVHHEKFASAEALCRFIAQKHMEYVGNKHGIEDDVRHIVEINQKVLAGIGEILAQGRSERMMAMAV